MLPLVAALAMPAAAPIPDRPDGLVIWSAPLLVTDHTITNVRAGVWTPDGKYVLTAGKSQVVPPPARSGEVRVWEAATGRLARTFAGDAGSYTATAATLAISPNGRFVASAGYAAVPGKERLDHFIEVWDWTRDRPVARFADGCDTTGIVFAPDGETVVTSESMGAVSAWSVGGWKPRWRTAIQTLDWPCGLAHHPRVSVVSVVDRNHAVWLLDATTGRALEQVSPVLPGSVITAAFSRDGRQLALGGRHMSSLPVGVVSLDAGGRRVEIGTLRRPTGWRGERVGRYVEQVAFSPDASILAAACSDGSVRLFDPVDCRPTAVGAEHTGPVHSVAFSPDGRRLLSVGRDAVKVWSVAELRARRPAP